MWRYDDSYILKMIDFKLGKWWCFNISTVQEVAPTQLYKKKHDTKISMVGDTLLLLVLELEVLVTTTQYTTNN